MAVGRLRRRKAIRLVAASALAFAAWASVAAAQGGGVDFVAEPAPGSQTAPQGGYFLLDATPGQEITQSIGLRNDSAGPLELRLAAVDAVTGQRGGASYALASETPTRTASWVTLERSEVTLQPRASAVVAFRVAVPADAASGHHLAGISISAPKKQGETAEADKGQAGASIDVQTRRIVAVQVNLPGPSDPKLAIKAVSPVARPDGLYLEIAIENEGHGLTKATGVLNVDDFERKFDVDTFVPQTSIAYPIKWKSEAANGDYQAKVELRYGEQAVAWTGTFTVGQAVLDELADRKVASDSDRSEKSSFPPTALLAAAVGAILLLGGGSLAFFRFRRPVGKHTLERARRETDTISRDL